MTDSTIAGIDLFYKINIHNYLFLTHVKESNIFYKKHNCYVIIL